MTFRSNVRAGCGHYQRFASGLFVCAIVIAVLPRSLRAQCNCTCDPLVPSSQQINAVLLNESGGSPTHFVSAGGPGGSAREIRHGNLFSGNITITHVCIALQYPSGQPGDIANVQIYQPDPDPINMNLPGVKMYDQQFQVSPGFNNHQIVQLVTPQTMTANFWLVVAYPTAQPAIGHQGTRPRTQGNSAVYVGGPPGPGFQPRWWYYDDINGPGGTAGYLGNAPIIRPLNIGPSSSACPYDAQCCSIVCGIQPSCCSVWDPLCESLAIQNCFPNGCVTCPPNGIPEGEACGTDINGGCNTNGVYQIIGCDQTVCGSVWRDNVTGLIDTDWYRISVDDLDGDAHSFLTFTVESEIALEVVLQNERCPQDPLWVIYNAATTQACLTKVFGASVPSPGTYRISVRPIGIVATCPQESKYTLWVDVDDCSTLPPPNDDCSSAIDVLPGGYPFSTIGATTDGPADGCFTGMAGQDSDIWYHYQGQCDGLTNITIFHALYDQVLSIYEGACPQAGGTLWGCATAPAGTSLGFTVPHNPGEDFYIRVGGVNGQQGAGRLDINVLCTCPADVAPPPFGDGTVNVSDLLSVINHWGLCPPPCPPYCVADINHDCTVNVSDLLAVINSWGPCP